MTPVGVFFTAFLPLGVNEQALCQQPHFYNKCQDFHGDDDYILVVGIYRD